MLSAPQPDLVRVDRARVIRRSSRCFAFGLVGAMPLLGLAPALLAIRLYRRVREQTGERWNPRNVFASWGVAGLFAWLYTWRDGVGGFLLVAAVGVFLQGAAWIEGYRRAEVLAWNPARARAWWGAALACTGIMLFFLSPELLLGFVLRGWRPFEDGP